MDSICCLEPEIPQAKCPRTTTDLGQAALIVLALSVLLLAQVAKHHDKGRIAVRFNFTEK